MIPAKMAGVLYGLKPMGADLESCMAGFERYRECREFFQHALTGSIRRRVASTSMCEILMFDSDMLEGGSLVISWIYGIG